MNYGFQGFSRQTVDWVRRLTVKGGLLIGTGGSDVAAQLAPGSDGQVLTADSTQPNGVKWSTSGAGSVTSVGLSLPADFTVTGSPVTGSGTLAATRASQSANLVLASPNGSSGTPGYRAIVPADLSLGSSIVMKGLDASKPSAGTAGRLYFSTDVSGGTLYRDNGSSWDQVAKGLTAAPQAHESTHVAGGSDALPWTTIHGSGTLASRPAAGTTNSGYIYLATDVSGGTLYRSDGSGWTQIAASVSSGGSSTLAGDSDVAISSPTNGQVLTYNSTSGKWQNQTGSGGGNVTSTGAAGSEPGSPNSGDLYLQNNGYVIERYSGSAWAPWGPIFPFTTPPAISSISTTTFGWVNQGSATASTTNGGIFLSAPPNSGTSFRLLVMTAPSTPYKITAAILPLLYTGGNQYCGLCFRNSTSGAIHAWGLTFNGTITAAYLAAKYTNATTFSASYATAGGLQMPPAPVMWLRIADDGTNRICSWGMDGVNFLPFQSVGRTDFLTADQVCFFVDNEQTTSAIGATLLSWAQS